MNEIKHRKGIVKYRQDLAGLIEETDSGYRFTYEDEFIKKGIAISFSLPIKNKVHESEELFSFFEGLLPEGWYLGIVIKSMKIDRNDKFGVLLATCKDTIGAVSVEEENETV